MGEFNIYNLPLLRPKSMDLGPTKGIFGVRMVSTEREIFIVDKIQTKRRSFEGVL